MAIYRETLEERKERLVLEQAESAAQIELGEQEARGEREHTLSLTKLAGKQGLEQVAIKERHKTMRVAIRDITFMPIRLALVLICVPIMLVMRGNLPTYMETILNYCF